MVVGDRATVEAKAASVGGRSAIRVHTTAVVVKADVLGLHTESREKQHVVRAKSKPGQSKQTNKKKTKQHLK